MNPPWKDTSLASNLMRRQWLKAFGVSFMLPSMVKSQTPITLEVAAFPAVDKIIKAASEVWRKQWPGVMVNVVSRSFSDHHTAMTTALATRSHLPDLMALEVGYLGRFANSGGFVPLNTPPFDVRQQTASWVRYAVEQAQDRKGVLRAMPLDIGPGTLFYRHDVLQLAGVSAQALQTDWASWLNLGRYVKQKTGVYWLTDAHDLKDAVIRTQLQAGEGLYFGTHPHAAVLVDSPRFVQAFEWAKQVRQQGLDGKARAWTSDWQMLLRSGRVATQMMGAWLGGHLANWLAPQSIGRWRVAPLPNQLHVAWGGTFVAIPQKATHLALALDLARYLTLDRYQQLNAFKTEDAFPSLITSYQDGFFEQPMPYFGGQAVRQIWRETAQKIQAIPVHPLDPLAADVVDAALDKVLLGRMDISTALGQAKQLLQYRLQRVRDVA